MTRLCVEARFRRAVHLAVLGCLAAAPVAAAQEPPPADLHASTGTRLGGTAPAGALPVTVITREEIDASGRSSLADFLRDAAFNSFGSFRPQSGSSAQGLAAMDLRGLGSERTLILVDGKRASQAPFAPVAQDLNAIPLGAVERIEILREGASVIYGSGAVAGVINIVVRKDFQGAELMHGRGYSGTGGGDTSQAGFLMGMPAGNGHVVIGASYNTRDIVFARDLVAAGVDEPGASLFANNYVTPADGFSTVNIVPGGCESSDAFYVGFVGTFVGSQPPDICLYDFNAVGADEAASDSMGLFAKGRFGINDAWSVYSTATVSRNTSFGRYAPAPSILFVPGAVSGIDHDGDGTDDTVYVYHRYDALGNRDDTLDGKVYDLMAGLDGTLAGFTLDFGGRYNEYQALNLGRNYVVDDIASALATAGVYNFRDPLSNDAATLNQMKATISRDMHWRSRQWWAAAQRDVFALPGGAARLALGAERESVDYADRYDSLSEGGAIGGSAGNSAGMGQATSAYFAELGLPLLPDVHANAALRYDDVSGVGGSPSSRLAASWQASPRISVRGSWNTGFRAPQLDALSILLSTSAGDCGITVPPCIPIEITTIRNPELESEKAEHHSLGLSVKPWDAVAFTLDYYDVTVDGVIALFSVSDLDNFENQGLPLPPGLSLTRGPGGFIESATVGYGNFGELRTRGLDIGAAADASLAGGRLASRVQLSSVLEYEFVDGGDVAGQRGAPDWRATWNSAWQSGPFALAWNQVAIAGQAGAGTWWTHDLQFAYDMPFNAGTLAVGALNLSNEMPPAYEYDGRPYNFSLYNAYGRTPYVRYTLGFR